MKKVAFLFLCVWLTSCGLFKSKKATSEAVEEPVEEEPVIEMVIKDQPPPSGIKMTYGEICETFLSTLQIGSAEGMNAYFPTVQVARSMSPNETNGKSDEEVEKMLAGMKNRFKENLIKLRAAAIENKVELGKLNIRNCLYFDSEDGAMVPRVLSVEIGTADDLYKIPITVLNYSGKTYVFEVLNTTNIFNK